MSKGMPSRFLPSSQMFPALCRCAQRRERSRGPAPAGVSWEVPRMRLWRQCLESFGLSKSSSKRSMIFSPLPSARSSSSKTGSETTYFSVAQLPRSRSRQRSLQKGKSAWTVESVSTLQMGHLCFMVRLFLLCELCVLRVLRVKSFNTKCTKTRESKVTSFSKEEYSSGQDAEGRPCGDAMKFFYGRNRRHGRRHKAGSCGRPGQDFHYPPDQVVSIRLGNLNACDVTGFRDFSSP